MHTWPELAKELITHRGTAAERSASGSMIVPELFPSSIVTFFRPAFRMICSPTGGEPEGRQRRGGRGLQDQRVPHGKRRPHLVRHQVQGKVERGDRRDHPQRGA